MRNTAIQNKSNKELVLCICMNFTVFSLLMNILPNKGPVTQNVRGGDNFYENP